MQNLAKVKTVSKLKDYLPEEIKKRDFLKNRLLNVFEIYGFDPLTSPALEYEEILRNKAGEERDKTIISFEKPDNQKIALRNELTIPTARVLAMHNQSLPMPWKRYQIQPVWRTDQTQDSYLEFLQCDADIYGVSSTIADAEIIALANSIYSNLGFSDYKIYINDRNILFELMFYASVPKELQFQTIAVIDKLDRKSKESVKKDLIEIGLSEKMVDHLYHHLDLAKPTDLLKQVIEKAQYLGVNTDNLVFEARLARGLDYYTSTIFEVKIEKYKGGSVLGGGRYNNLIGQLSGFDIPAVGFGLGFDRTLEAMEQFELFPEEDKRKGTLVSVFNRELATKSLEVAKTLRENNMMCEVYPSDDTKLDKQLKHADKKLIKWFIVIGPDEAEKETIIIKDLETGHQEDVKMDKLTKYLEEKLE